jgi:hypothetical protein
MIKPEKLFMKAPFNIEYPGYNDIIWYNLWEECDKSCPYTGNPYRLRLLIQVSFK